MVSPSSPDIIYPQTNAKEIENIAENGLIISEYKANYRPHKVSFLSRNRIIIDLSDIVIIPQADLRSGSMSSANLALKAKKPLFVLPHRINESLGTNALLEKNLARGIYDLDNFVKELGLSATKNESGTDELLEFCKSSPSFEEAFLRFGDKLLEYELNGAIRRENGFVRLA